AVVRKIDPDQQRRFGVRRRRQRQAPAGTDPPQELAEGTPLEEVPAQEMRLALGLLAVDRVEQVVRDLLPYPGEMLGQRGLQGRRSLGSPAPRRVHVLLQVGPEEPAAVESPTLQDEGRPRLEQEADRRKVPQPPARLEEFEIEEAARAQDLELGE